ncbi:MAG: hypothetical protein AAF737_04595 [Pseudomonadota bacterium]
MSGFEFGVDGVNVARWVLMAFLFGAFMAWPLMLVVTTVESRHEGRVLTFYAVGTFFAGSLFFATMVEPMLAFATARQLYLIYMILMAGLCIKGAYHAFDGDDLMRRLPV